jgi:hypothetical protein
MSKTIAIIGVPWSTHELVPAIRDAKSLGARLCLVDTTKELECVDMSLDLDRLPVKSLSVKEVIPILADHTPSCVVSLTEMTMECAAGIREGLGFVGTTAETERAVSDKVLTRKILKKNNLTEVDFWETTVSDLDSIIDTLSFPLILKPCVLTGSAGVRLINARSDILDLKTQYDLTTASLFGRDRLLLETFVPGEEVSVEGLTVNGELTIFAITDKFNTGSPNYFEVGHVIPSRHTREWKIPIRDYLEEIIDILDIVTSPIHAELKIADGQLELIEIHSRFGGDNIIRLLEESTGLRPFESYFAAMLEQKKPILPESKCISGIGYFTSRIGHPVNVRSLDFPHPSAIIEIDFNLRRKPKLENYEGIKLLYWRPGHVLFGSERYEDVYSNVAFMAEQLCSQSNCYFDGRKL